MVLGPRPPADQCYRSNFGTVASLWNRQAYETDIGNSQGACLGIGTVHSKGNDCFRIGSQSRADTVHLHLLRPFGSNQTSIIPTNVASGEKLRSAVEPSVI